MAANRIFCCQGNTAQHDEDEDEIGKDVVIDEPVASHSNSEEETQKHTMCANTLRQMAETRHVLHYSASRDRTEQLSAAKSGANAEAIALISKTVNKFNIQSTCSEDTEGIGEDFRAPTGFQWVMNATTSSSACTTVHIQRPMSKGPMPGNKSSQIPSVT